MGEVSSEYTLDRIDNNKGYCKSNCRWATWEEQIINRRTYANNTSGHTGIHLDKLTNKWHARATKNGNRKYIGYFDTLEEAIRELDGNKRE